MYVNFVSLKQTIMQKPKLVVWCGPMMAGKTMALIDAYNAIPQCDRIAVKPRIDTRHVIDRIVAHNGQYIEAITLDNLQEIKMKVAGINNIFIDEGQFFIDLADKTAELLTAGKNVYVSGLNATAQQRPWPSMSEIFAMADEIYHMQTLCHECGKRMASHTVLRDVKSIKIHPVIKIGGSATYKTVCRACLTTYQQ